MYKYTLAVTKCMLEVTKLTLEGTKYTVTSHITMYVGKVGLASNIPFTNRCTRWCLPNTVSVGVSTNPLNPEDRYIGRYNYDFSN